MKILEVYFVYIICKIILVKSRVLRLIDLEKSYWSKNNKEYDYNSLFRIITVKILTKICFLFFYYSKLFYFAAETNNYKTSNN